MSYAPARLVALQRYLHDQTGLPLVSLGIVGDAAHRGGYHCGRDRLVTNDYSARTSRDRAGLTNGASASDIGNFRGLVRLTMWVVGEARAGRRPDTREIIGPWSDGRAYRFDHLDRWRAELRSRGDSHETHMHESWYRDSEDRDKIRYFRPFFEGEDDVDLDDRVNLWDEKGNKPWRAGKSIGVTKEDPSVSVGQLLMWGGEVGHLTHNRVLPALAEIRAMLKVVAGQDAAAAVRAEIGQLTDTLVAAVRAAVPEANQATVEAALREVLGSLDES